MREWADAILKAPSYICHARGGYCLQNSAHGKWRQCSWGIRRVNIGIQKAQISYLRKVRSGRTGNVKTQVLQKNLGIGIQSTGIDSDLDLADVSVGRERLNDHNAIDVQGPTRVVEIPIRVLTGCESGRSRDTHNCVVGNLKCAPCRETARPIDHDVGGTLGNALRIEIEIRRKRSHKTRRESGGAVMYGTLRARWDRCQEQTGKTRGERYGYSFPIHFIPPLF